MDDSKAFRMSEQLGEARAIAQIEIENIESILAAIDRAGLMDALKGSAGFVLATESHRRMIGQLEENRRG